MEQMAQWSRNREVPSTNPPAKVRATSLLCVVGSAFAIRAEHDSTKSASECHGPGCRSAEPGLDVVDRRSVIPLLIRANGPPEHPHS